MPPDPHEIRTEWSLVLDGDLTRLHMGHHHEKDGLDEVTARRQREAWRGHWPKVETTLRRRPRITYVGPWEVVE